MDQVREILFGAERREIERRIARADAHVSASLDELQRENRRRSEVVEAHFRQETEAMAAHMERELLRLNEAIQNLTRDHRELMSNVEQRAVKVEESVERSHREVRQLLLAQAKSFIDELQALRRELTTKLELEFGVPEHALLTEDAEHEPGGRKTH